MLNEHQIELVIDELKIEPKIDPISKHRIKLARVKSLVGTTPPKYSSYATGCINPLANS